jgi:LAO/AO transport system kinase
MEIADVFVINKADRPGAADTRRDLEQMLDLTVGGEWRPPILTTIATAPEGIDELWAAVASHRAFLEADGRLEERRARRLREELTHIVAERLLERARAVTGGEGIDAAAAAVLAREVDPWTAADALLSSALETDG